MACARGRDEPLGGATDENAAATGARGGVASGFDVTVRALVWMLAGHELHHRMLIRRDYMGEPT